jgi:hypothetical protein
VVVIDTSVHTVFTTIPLAGPLTGIGVNRAGTTAYVARALPGPGQVHLIDLATDTVSGTTITVGNLPIAAGLFIGSYAPAATAPGAPTIGAATPGDTQASIAFTAPASDGGSPITGYTATCNPNGFTGTGAASPIVVTGLTNGVAYSCSVTATNAIDTGPASGTVSVTPAAPFVLATTAVVSRKTHGGTGVFEQPIDFAQPPAGAVSVEPRAIGAGHTIVFQFNGAIGNPGSVTSSAGAAASIASGNEVVVTLTGVADNSRVTVSLTGVNGVLSQSATIGFLVGDVNGSRSVTATDIVAVKARSGQLTAAGNFKFDLNASGSITATDILAVKGRSGFVLP